MKLKKNPRINVNIECLLCRKDKEKIGVSRYTTEKSKLNSPLKLELNKYCKFCAKHTKFKEIKK